MVIGWREAAERLKEREGMSALTKEEFRLLFIKSRKSLPVVVEEHYKKGVISEETYKRLKELIGKDGSTVK